MYLFISGAEIFVVLVIVVMLFGADKLPEIARGLGKGMRQVKDATNDIKREIKNSAERHDIDIDIASNVKKEVNKVTDNFDDFSNPVKKVTKTIIDDIKGPVKRKK
jgi:sec-independent protein translocase protein TatA